MPNPLTERQIKEFRKTAKLVAESPWHLLKAEAFLERMLDENIRHNVRPLLPHQQLRFVFNYQMTEVQRHPGQALLVDHHPIPREVRVIKPDAAECARRRKRLRGPHAQWY